MFTLEVLKAKHGDCLILRHGLKQAPRNILIDGGPSGVYSKFLRPRLTTMRRGKQPVRLDLVMVSHLDHDHIRGIIDLFREAADKDDRERLDVRISALWHNAFERFTPEPSSEDAETAALQVADTAKSIADISDPDIDLVLEKHTKLVLSSVKEGLTLQELARKLAVKINPDAESGLVLAGHQITSGDLTLEVIGPTRDDADDLKKKWDKEVEKLLAKEKEEQMEAADYLDRSVFNLSSLVVVARAEGKSMLLTGDARGDKVLDNLRTHGLMDENDQVHFDLVKLPHHGSDRNVDDDFFEKVIADHYVISGDGRHHNPEIDT
ncbi:MAG: MBL fold metallo-hydrolase, partial [Pseudomonadota bacterium]